VKQKNIPFFWAFLMHIISTEIFLDLRQFFLRPWNKTKNHGPQILYMCNFVLVKTNDN
jgi:hypothetical protein